MKVSVKDVMLDTETGEQFALPTTHEAIYPDHLTLNREVKDLDAIVAASKAADDEIEIPPVPEGTSLVEWLIEQSVIPADTPVFEVSNADDIVDIIENHVEGQNTDKTLH